MNQSDAIRKFKQAMIDAGSPLQAGAVWGPLTTEEAAKYDFTIKATPKKNVPKPVPAGTKPVIKPEYWKEHKFHPMFKVPPPYTHPHPFDILKSVEGEHEILGDKDNDLIAHFHEHSGNLGTHSDNKNDYHDEVPHCASAQNWAQDGAGCYKTDNALASSYQGYAKKFGSRAYKKGDTIPKGAIICIKGHVTRANEEFVWTGKGNFPGFGSNQGNAIKTSIYKQSAILTICDDMPKPGTVLAPAGTLTFGKEKAATSGEGESTR